MRLKLILPVFLLLTVLHLDSIAQKLTFGPVSGINFSNLRGEMTYNTWNAKPGPVNGIFARAKLGNWLALRTGAEFTSFYYQEKWKYTDYYTGPVPTDFSFSSSIAPRGCIIGPSSPSNHDYHFLRIPLMLEWKTPGRLSFGFGAGAHYSFLMNDEFTGKDKELHSEEYHEENFPPATDWGWMLSASLNYAANSRWNIFLEGRTTTGKEVYLESVEGKNGSSELLFGVGFSPFSKPVKEQERPAHGTGQRIEIMPHAGISYSKSADPDNKNDYASLPALNSGVSVKFKADTTFSIISGAWVERKGYRIEKPSQSRVFYNYIQNDEHAISLQSDILLDYLTLPLLGELSFGHRFTTNFQFGFYYALLQNARATGQETRKYNFGNGYQVQREYFDQNVEGWFKNDDFGAITGLRFEYRIFLKTKIYTALQRTWGFTELGTEEDNSDASVYAPSPMQYFKNRSLKASFGLSIPLVQN